MLRLLHRPVELAQDPRRLCYALFLGAAARNFDPSRLTIVQEARAAVGPWTATIAIIGESHFVSLAAPDGRVHVAEVLACVEPTTCGSVPTVRRHCDADVEPLDIAAAGIAVRVSFARSSRRQDGWVLPPPRRGETGVALVHTFPGSAMARTFVGVTVVHTGDEGRWRMRVSSIHEYIQGRDAIVVTSQSDMDLREEA